MPFPILAHQAVVVPLKLRWPRWFSGTALCLGSAAPDVEYLVRDRGPGVAHTWIGQLTFCLPLTLLGFSAVAYVLVPALAPRAAGRLDQVARPPRGLADGARVIASALVGSASHLIADGITHRDGWLPRLLPPLAGARLGGFELLRILQYGLSLVGVVVGLLLLARFVRRARAVATSVTASRSGTIALVVGASAGAALGLFAARAVIRTPTNYFFHARLHAVGYTGFSVACGLFVGLVAGALACRVLDARAQRLLAPPSNPAGPPSNPD